MSGTHVYTTSYTWSKNAQTYGRYTVRKTGMTMPDSRAITYTYDSSSGLHDDEASRVSTVKDGGTVTLAQYSYLGAGTVVRQYLSEINCMSRVYDDTNAYVDLDTFNRITTTRWTKDLGTDRDFYSVALTYDRNSNITSAKDNVHGAYHSFGSGYDVAYTMDNVNRLTEAKEGTLASGSITTPTRDEQWTLSHTGNWDREKLDLNGDGDFVDANELDDTRTHNAVNELLARDTDSNSSNNYTLNYDNAGNLIDDGKDYKYIYDVWGRLRKVTNQATPAVLVAEYRYNGLNHRIATHEDTVVSGVVDSSDPWYYDVFDERWRLLARYRDADANPKEDFVPHQAGADGDGGASYIDLVICRNKDANTAWTSASDNTLEERNYYCQNWRADVSAIVNVAATTLTLVEWDKYSAYGTPIGLPGGDSDSDGDIDATDRTNVQTWINGSTYDVRGDIDLDGDVDATDKGKLVAKTLGRGVLSPISVANRKGYAGYEALSGVVGSHWIARTRVLRADLGRWLMRDRAGYDNEPNLYTLWGDEGVAALDPFGEKLIRDCPGASAKWTAYADCILECLRVCPDPRVRALVHYIEESKVLVSICGYSHQPGAADKYEQDTGHPAEGGLTDNDHHGRQRVYVWPENGSNPDTQTMAHELGHVADNNAEDKDNKKKKDHKGPQKGTLPRKPATYESREAAANKWEELAVKCPCSCDPPSKSSGGVKEGHPKPQ